MYSAHLPQHYLIALNLALRESASSLLYSHAENGELDQSLLQPYSVALDKPK
jgi:hypothetical protein